MTSRIQPRALGEGLQTPPSVRLDRLLVARAVVYQAGGSDLPQILSGPAPLAPEYFPRSFAGRWQITLQVAIEVANEQAAATLALVHQTGRPSDNLPSQMIGTAWLELSGRQRVDDLGVDGVIGIEPLLVRDQVPLARQVVRLIHDAKTALTSDLD